MYKDKSATVYDVGGLALQHARRLATDFGSVGYFTPYFIGDPKFKDFSIGLGFPELEKKKYFFDDLKKSDLIAFFDVGAGDMAHFLRESGLRVYGAGLGERLELQRWDFRQIQKRVGLPTQRTALVKGVKALRKYLSKHPKQFVKLDAFRGDVESFPVDSYEQVEIRLNDLEYFFGPYAEKYQFVVEEFIEAELEIGMDVFFNGMEFLRPLLIGVEYGKSSYIGKFVQTAPSYIENTITRLTPTLQRLNYRGALSTEERVVSPRKSYLIDFTARFPFPLSTVYTEVIENYSEVIWKVAGKEAVKVKNKAQYVGVLPLSSNRGRKNWVYLDYEESPNIKPFSATRVDDRVYGVKGTEGLFVLIAWADSVKEVVSILKKNVGKVNADGLKTDTAKELDEITKIVKKVGWE